MDIKQTINGVEYDVCYPDSWYIADLVCKQRSEGYELRTKKEGFVAQIFLHPKKQLKCFYDPEHKTDVLDPKAPPKCLGWLIWNMETNNVTLRKTAVDSEMHEYHKEDCLAVSYDIFKNLRDMDVIQIHTDFTDKDGVVTPMIYRIKKYKAAKLGDFKQFSGHGLQYFIPKDAFWKEIDKTKLRSKKVVKRKTKPKRTKEEIGRKNCSTNTQGA